MKKFKVHLTDGSVLEFYAKFYWDNNSNGTIEFMRTVFDATNKMFPLTNEKIGEVNRSLVKYIQGEDDEN